MHKKCSMVNATSATYVATDHMNDKIDKNSLKDGKNTTTNQIWYKIVLVVTIPTD